MHAHHANKAVKKTQQPVKKTSGNTVSQLALGFSLFHETLLYQSVP
jgi:hypothetical protein